MKTSNKLIITIGRKYGSGGRAVGDLLAKRLKIPFYDKELLKKTSEESGFSEEFIATHEEQRSSGFAMGASRLISI